MATSDSYRTYSGIIKEICDELNIECETFADEWVFKLTKGNMTRIILGYRFGLNDEVSSLLCNDKSVTFNILKSYDIPVVPHFFFQADYGCEGRISEDDRKWLLNLLSDYRKLVLKPNDGNGGKNVFLVDEPSSLLETASRIFGLTEYMAVSPYYDIQREYRLILLNGELRIAYHKQRMSGEWRHNLGLGAKACLSGMSEIEKDVLPLAKEATEKLGLKFASVDIIRCPDKRCGIMEINSGVMMAFFAAESSEYRSMAKAVYKDVIEEMFA